MKLRKFILILLLMILFSSVFQKTAYAVEDPLAVPNNPFGIHILHENDIDSAADLVNSNGGDWGYVTLVIRNDERDAKRWQNIFDEMRKLHLIPILRLATIQTADGWEKPKHAEIDAWVSFLDQLNWVVKNRYVVIGNEPNHAKEWGGEINPEEYANYLFSLSQKLKERSDEFFIMPAGFDASAPNSKETISEELYIDLMLQSNINTFEYIDGWASHSYPNPNFSGSVYDNEKGSIRTYEWEVGLLKNLGINREFPVFITETGWANDIDGKSKYSNENDIGKNLTFSYEEVWNDKNIVAITPFILNYENEPFDIFSWTKPDGSFYQFYHKVKELQKPMGTPIQKNIIKVLVRFTPEIFSFNGKRFSLAVVKNTGQKIWTKKLLQFADSRSGKILIQPIKYFGDTQPGDYTLAFVKKS
ncbi:hypothetical protein JXA63_05405 [Candidatus Woesebacteria bacterium]|nr:hypothetical protein [Candidatus Woesebacteria bacterium]